ncbi:DUF4825 domain-containing protein, partial [Bacillus thuringiensis]|nr:DUF4825 domain-containing protein [Bacillus thuringiensis]
DFTKEKDICDKNKLIKFFNGNEQKIKMLVEDKDFRKSLFAKYPVSQLK